MWHVRLATGEVRSWTLDQLDDAFQKGVIDENTLVMSTEMFDWAPLGEIAGLDQAPAVQAAPASSVSPMSIMPPSAPPPPVVADIDVDFEMPNMRRGGSKKPLFFALAGAAVFGAIVFAATRSGAPAEAVASDVSAAAAHVAEPPPPPPPPRVDPTPPPAATRAALDDTQKKALAEADKSRAEKAAARKAKRTPKPRAKSASPFVKKGDKYDPLNSSL
jgi:hypothetical protein